MFDLKAVPALSVGMTMSVTGAGRIALIKRGRRVHRVFFTRYYRVTAVSGASHSLSDR